MDLKTRILEDSQANAGQVQSNPEALATIGKALAGLAMKAHFNDLNAFLKEFKGTEVFQTLLKNNQALEKATDNHVPGYPFEIPFPYPYLDKQVS